jgi:hypothetical protein
MAISCNTFRVKRLAAIAGTIVVLLASTASLQGQALNVGIKGGYSPATLNGDDVGRWLADEAGKEAGWRQGFTAGAFLTWRFHPRLALQPEVLYTQKGAVMDVLDEGVDIHGKARFDYVEIPLLLKFMVPVGPNPTNPYLFAGPMVAIKTTCDFTAEATIAGTELRESANCGETMTFGDETEQAPDIKNVDYGITFGGGVGFPVGSVQLWLDGRYVMALGNVPDEGPNTSVYNRSFAATIAVSVPLWTGTRFVAAR